MGLQSLKIADIHFDNVKLHKSSLLGTEGKGINVMMKSMEIMRISNSAVALGIAERAFEEAVAYSKLRQVNSVPMYKLSTVQFELAEMKAKLELMRLAVFYTSELLDNNTPGILNYVNTCKLKTTEYAKEICDRALQIFGGYGYVRGYTVERLYRDVRILSIIGGTSESLKWSIFNSIIG
ncbi:acyl-CoA dehydrogenase [Acetivibrio straminisolvens]|nr:acyl-CoA dehydrogenase [Acetivibrio straminisolvens]GAE86874.1 butyryl-CoA dehydrogenase [Acetivibrio straminisolvens JCM 21531]